MPRKAFAWWRESMRSQKRVFIRSLTDLPEDATKERELYSALDARSLIAVPLGIGDQELGFVGFDSVRRQIDWDEESIALLQLLGDIFVSAFQRRQTEDALADERLSLARRVEERTAELEIQYGREAALASIEPNIGQPGDLTGVLNRMVELAAEVLDTTGASVLLRDMETDRFATIAATPALRPAQDVMTWVRQESGATRWIATHRKPFVVTDREDAALLSALPIPLNPMMAEAGLRAFVGVPLMAQDEVVGVLYVLDKDARQFSTAEMDFLFALARRGALAVSNVQLYKTLQQANHELARAARLKDDFLASMSHELRTPLNAILGMSESLMEEIYGPISEEQHYPIQAVNESGRNLLALINDILDLSRIEAGQAEIYLEQVHIPSVCRGSMQFVHQKAMKRQIKINIDVAEDVQQHAIPVWADERRLKQILVNLLSNAVKFTPEGGEIGLEVRYDSMGTGVRFDVWDTGIGIAPENLPHLFQPFAQLDSSLNRHYNGTGLGLALVHRMTQMHGGTVEVESQLGVGSRFSVWLPCRPLDLSRDDVSRSVSETGGWIGKGSLM
jgi:signal transduction histidine kinase